MAEDKNMSDSDKLDRLLVEIAYLKHLAETHSELIDSIQEALYGKKGQFGIAQQMKVVWGVHTWLMCTLSAGMGAIGYAIINHLIKRVSS